jgi:large subunit ribosomal protein L23
MFDDAERLRQSSEKAEIVKSGFSVVRALLRTEKGTVQAKDNKYFFAVLRDANKIQIRKAVEDLYKVKVESVNTVVMPGKMKRVRTQAGLTPDWKKAVVTLKTGQKIDVA